ncbi:MAG: tetratricopeptide repeat protein [Chloroflexi bacterium]|nr:tetratricopeptide repeat protein [Chloroflexota bacterium]
MMIWVGLILVGYMVFRSYQQGSIKPFFSPTATPTRTTESYEQEADTYFQLGKLDCEQGRQDCAIGAYQNAARLDPNNAELWARLARVQTYSSRMLTTDEERLQRLKEALTSIDKAAKLAPDDSNVHAIRAFVLDWLASSVLLSKDETTAYLAEAETEANQAIRFDQNNALALAFFAEVQVDQAKWLQAQKTIQQALDRDPNSMDVRRVNGYVLEWLGEYEQSVAEYEKAAEITPNLTFLYIQIGIGYRNLHDKKLLIPDEQAAQQYLDKALEAFTKAVNINLHQVVKDPIPYLEIAKTYTQVGEFFSAVRNVRKALEISPTNPDVYARLGLVYHQSRNYEGEIPAFQCALEGCTPDVSCKVRDDCGDGDPNITISPIGLTDSTVVYYYTYGSVLAALSKAGDQRCTKAEQIFAKLKAAYPPDAYFMGIVQAGEGICSKEASSTQSATGQPAGTQPAVTSTPVLK